MKQVLQDLKGGRTEVADVPCPMMGRGHLLVRSARTLVSAGTERMLVDFGKAGWLEKARMQPDKVRLVLEKIKTDGVLPTFETVSARFDQPLPMGYCNVGEVVEIGAGVNGFRIGDRVASNGRHAEVVAVPANLCAKVPPAVGDDAAAFTVLGAVALQGIRLVQPTLGEAVVVTGLGLIGLVTVQLLRAHGCRVLGVDFDSRRLELARHFGAEVASFAADGEAVAAAMEFSRGRGVDAVIITAATRSSEPVHQAALMCRKRGRIVLVGVAGLELSRADFYEKELTFQVSCSYGPGRYDPAYEEKGQDYPLGFVRWTEQRNFEAVLDMLDGQRLDVAPLVSHRFGIDEATKAYEVLAGNEPSLGILLEYPMGGAARPLERTVRISAAPSDGDARAVVGFIGAGNYARAVLIPAFRASGARLLSIASAGGVSALHAGRKFGFERATTEAAGVIDDREANTVVISTRHDSHASFVLAARAAGKHVFVEKPLCLTLDELARIESAYAPQSPLLMVGFNRRFAPHVQRIQSLLAAASGPNAFIMTVNAGAVPPGHWSQDIDSGGGRLIGENCHFIDLLRFLAAAPITSHNTMLMDGPTQDSATVTLQFANGSIGTIHYLANGNKSFPKERLEVFAAGSILRLDNYRKLTGFGWPGFRSMSAWRQDKGQNACAQAFVDAVRNGGPAPIPLTEIIEVSRVSIEAAQRQA
jgi:predicted dehydrogenase